MDLKEAQEGNFVEILIDGREPMIRQVIRHTPSKTKTLTVTGIKGKFPLSSKCIDLGPDINIMMERFAKGGHDFE